MLVCYSTLVCFARAVEAKTVALMARAGRRARQRARASAARRLTQQRAEQQRDRRERVERARRRRQELIRRHGPLGPILQRLDDDSDSSSSPDDSSSDESSDDESRVDEQALSPYAVFHEYASAAKFERLVDYLRRNPSKMMLRLLEGELLNASQIPGGGGLATRVNEFGQTMLHLAAELEDPAIASMLLRYGADPNAGTEDDEMPLHIAAEAGAHRTLACLLDNGAEVDVQDDMGYTPLMCAAECNSRECCVALIAAGANVHYKDEDEVSALFYAVTEHKHPRCIVPLLDAGAEASVDILRRAVQEGSPRGLHPLLRVPPATDANFNMRRFLDSRELLLDVDGWRLWAYDRKAMRVNLAYLERVVAAGGIFRYERDERRRLVSLLRRHVAPRAPDDVLHVIVSFWGHPGSY